MRRAPVATILLTTKNRREDLCRALCSAVAQEDTVVEVIVIDDGSTDGTSDLVRKQFPSVRLERRDVSRGLIVRRNEGARLAAAPVIVSLDDDAEFSSPHIVAKTLTGFEHPRIGAVAIPFVNVLQGSHIFQRAPEELEDVFVTDAYIGTAHALRRDIFLTLGGYREHFIHQGEEGDYCLRMMDAGYVVHIGRAEPILHYESPKRDWRRMDFHGRRNDVLFALHNVPVPDLLVHLAGTLFNGARAAVRSRHPVYQFAGLAAGLCEGARRWTTHRKPASREIYRLHRCLKKGGPRPLSEIEAVLPPLISADHSTLDIKSCS